MHYAPAGLHDAFGAVSPCFVLSRGRAGVETDDQRAGASAPGPKRDRAIGLFPGF